MTERDQTRGEQQKREVTKVLHMGMIRGIADNAWSEGYSGGKGLAAQREPARRET